MSSEKTSLRKDKLTTSLGGVLLSIGIPTYNRAHFLESCLSSIAPQVSEFGGEVELIVSDNCSTDSTRAIVDWARQFCQIKYSANASNIGPIRNLLRIPQELASGTFCWLLGDDEMIRDGGVRAIVSAIRANPELDCFYVNYSIHELSLREGRVVRSSEFRATDVTGSSRREEGRVACWDRLIAEDRSALTPIYCSVFRRERWLAHSSRLVLREPYGNVDSTYPQCVILLRMMVRKPSWASGFPWVVMCGKESWTEYVPLVVLVRFHELLDLMVASGVDDAIVLDHRKRMLSYSGSLIVDMLLGRELRGLERFSMPKFLFRHRSSGALWYSLERAVASRAAGAVKGVAHKILGSPSRVMHLYKSLFRKSGG